MYHLHCTNIIVSEIFDIILFGVLKAQTKNFVKYFDGVGLICLEISPPQCLMEYEVNEESEPILIVAPLFTL